jgi:hypothetical protein
VNEVTIIFPDNTGTRRGTCKLPWVQGKRLQYYLHDPPLRYEGLIKRSMRCYIYKSDGTKVRLQHEPRPGETLTFVYAPRAVS